MTVAETPTTGQEARTARVLLYSSNRARRDEVRTLVGRRASFDTPLIEWFDVATPAAVITATENEKFDLLILDGEAGKHGGIGLTRTLKSEVFNLPPVLLIIARPDDKWLAAWSEAEGVVSDPLDPIVVQEAVALLLREGHR